MSESTALPTTPGNYIADIWRDQYLATFVAQGGSKIKFVSGSEGAGKTNCANRFLQGAAANGYKTVRISAKQTWLHDFQHVYSAIFDAIDFENCIAACASKVVVAMGYRPEEIPRSTRFAQMLTETGTFDPLTKREIRSRLAELFFDNQLLDSNFALASALLTGDALGYPELEEVSRESILAWLRAEKGVRIATLRRAGLSPSRITRYNARHMLRSLLEVVKLAGFTGLAVAIDDLEMLIETSTLEEVRYTKMRREDAYESIRELIDDIDTLGHFMLVFSLDTVLLEDETKGFKSYQALWMRIQNEIISEKANCFADIIDLTQMQRQLKDSEQTVNFLSASNIMNLEAKAETGGGSVSGMDSQFEARRIIEALRSGVSSFALGQYFASARPRILNEFEQTLDNLAEGGPSSSRVISAKYGEGKTHLLNTVFDQARRHNMVVSRVVLSKETPFSNLSQLYSKIVQGTYLPGNLQPGIVSALEQLASGTRSTSDLCEFCLTHLETNKLYYVLKSYLGTQDDEEKYQLATDIGGDFMTVSGVRKVYRHVFGEAPTFNQNFKKSRHVGDYLAFLSQLFKVLGYGGWVLLFDEAELVGRLGRKSRQKAYLNMNTLLRPTRLERTWSLFAFNSSFAPDVIEAKHEYEALEDVETFLPDELAAIRATLRQIEEATQLTPLTREETADVLGRILTYHGAAFNWNPQMDTDVFLLATDPYGYLLRTRIRAAIEMLDQLYLYGEMGNIQVGELGQIRFDEDDVSLEGFL